MADQPAPPIIDAVVIGRNEGARLGACIRSLLGQVRRVIYVDSNSTDGSQDLARALGATVVALDMAIPFTAARARNAGLEELGEDTTYVQFVDGDCIVVAGWVTQAAAFLEDHPEAAIACGRRREEKPGISVYNRLCDAEWNTPVGQARACGGDALMRCSALRKVGGFRSSLIAGEEPEMCVRLRQNGWSIWRLDAEMTRHDARILRFSQWWRRSRRAGHAFAEGAALHGSPPERHWVAETRRALIWGAIMPALILAFVLTTGPIGLLAVAIYPLQILRLARRQPLEQAVFLVLGKFPESLGALEFHLNRLRGRRRGILEYQ